MHVLFCIRQISFEYGQRFCQRGIRKTSFGTTVVVCWSSLDSYHCTHYQPNKNSDREQNSHHKITYTCHVFCLLLIFNLNGRNFLEMLIFTCRVLCNTEWHKKTGTFEKANKNWRNPRKKIIGRNWTITTCLVRDSNPNYQCLKITSCRWRLPPRMHLQDAIFKHW